RLDVFPAAAGTVLGVVAGTEAWRRLVPGIVPVIGRRRVAATVLSHGRHRLAVASWRAHGDQDAALAEALVVVAGLLIRDASAGQGADDAAASGADGHSTDRRRKRPGRDDRTDAGDARH